jgi:hypothetical protein
MPRKTFEQEIEDDVPLLGSMAEKALDMLRRGPTAIVEEDASAAKSIVEYVWFSHYRLTRSFFRTRRTRTARILP